MKKNNFDIIVTGGAGFIGEKITSHLVANGLNVAVLDKKLGHDLDDEQFVESWFNQNQAPYLVNCFALDDNIGSSENRTTFLNVELNLFSEYLRTNVISLFSVCREYIRNQQNGKIVNLSSIYSIVSPRNDIYGGVEKNVAYGVSKAAVNQLTRHLAVHSAPNFTSNSVVLGGVQNFQPEEFVSAYSKNVPLGRMAVPKDIFGIIDFLCSPKSDYCTGAEFIIDGGWTSW